MPPKEKKSVKRNKSRDKSTPMAEKQPAKREITGLCVNCDKRLTCRHCRQLGGVWYCEEYE